MKKLITLCVILIISLSVYGQKTQTYDLIIQKSNPLLHLKGSGAVLNFNNNDILLTESTDLLTGTGGNITFPNFIQGYTTTVTTAGTTTLTVNSTHLQFFTGVTTQTVIMPVVSTLTLGQQFYIINNSTGAITINSSGGNVLTIMASGTRVRCTCISLLGTDATSWSFYYQAISAASGKKLTVSNTLTLAGTDATTITFPSISTNVQAIAVDTCKGYQTKAVGNLSFLRVTAASTLKGLSGGWTGQRLSILNTSATTLVLQNNGTGTQKFMIQGGSDLTLNVQYQAVNLIFDGTYWFITGKNF